MSNDHKTFLINHYKKMAELRSQYKNIDNEVILLKNKMQDFNNEKI